MTLSSEQKPSYGQILKSSSIIGASSVIVVILRVVQAKAMAILLGPSGVGLIGIYGSVIDLLVRITGMGINNSGVRQIAEAEGSRDEVRIARTVITLRRTVLALGTVGMLGTMAFREAISKATFGNTDHAGAMGILAMIPFFGAVSGGQIALIQGMRRIGDLAKVNIFGALLGVLFSIPLVYFWRKEGIAFFLVGVSGMGILTSWWYARRIPIAQIKMSWRAVSEEARALMRLGFVFMITGLMTMGTMYLVRVILVRQLGLEAAGFFQASSAISSLYVGFILTAMGADFYPRLTAVAGDSTLCNRLVNEQVEVSLLLAVPGIVATLTFAPFVIQIFYSSRFVPAIDIMRWELLGILLRVASWPLGFVLLAKGKGKLFFVTELLANSVYLCLVVILLRVFELPGVGMAFFGLYVFYWILIFSVVHQLSGFKLSSANRKICGFIAFLVTVVFLGGVVLPGAWGTGVGTIVTIGLGLYCLNSLRMAMGMEKFRDAVNRVRSLLRAS